MSETGEVVSAFIALSVLTSLLLGTVTDPFSAGGGLLAVGAYVATFMLASGFIRMNPSRSASSVWKAVIAVVAASLVLDVLLVA
ncbi:hypothetical protein SAMN06269185_2600 [Natronoarchaeum philippinense]|uniref:Uncharacterized protein n=1 Tax=Natronoarchaeum philippinense TaxID=558529 RepID=A0A285P7E7_NATPI|nr:hypothetical protein [Natronoarchaeum philippinense]SNZ15791.1 hypothetical protein SAMN06269185_2600 [Natronoarchaeum philippinense]